DDFTFTLSFPGGEPLKVTATGFYSQRPEEMEGTELGGGTFRYVIRRLAEPWTVTVSPDPASGFVDNEITADGRVWTYASTLYISSDKAARANIYTLSGTLLKQLNVTAGTTSAQLERGLYVVEIDGTRYKVVVK
ncbi:MAG: T9SS type A sorting domain-containing protein, partial [Tannerella sp.]|nr:T9SS type A sorting domain-containing protein [Tannerella sp.]